MIELVPYGIAAIAVHACTSDVDGAKVIEIAQPAGFATLAVPERRVRRLEAAQRFPGSRARGTSLRIASQIAEDITWQCGRAGNACWAWNPCQLGTHLHVGETYLKGHLAPWIQLRLQVLLVLCFLLGVNKLLVV